MTRRVEEGDLSPVVLDLVRADVLGDTPGFARRDVRRADRVEQARLAMVDVAEDGDDRGALLELRGVDVLPEDLLRRDRLRCGLFLRRRRRFLFGAGLDPELVRDEGRGLE